eukprot:Skav234586  [mRNA]  locus=scaffold313:355749:359169:- [translate_table: standard]
MRGRGDVLEYVCPCPALGGVPKPWSFRSAEALATTILEYLEATDALAEVRATAMGEIAILTKDPWSPSVALQGLRRLLRRATGLAGPPAAEAQQGAMAAAGVAVGYLAPARLDEELLGVEAALVWSSADEARAAAGKLGLFRSG